jgi:dihydroorotase
MKESSSLLIKGGQAVLPNANGLATAPSTADIGIRDGKISEIGILKPADYSQVFNADGLTILPGLIDSQVHFRDPGYPHKEDLATGTLSALLGGITCIFDMPNTKPPTISALDFTDKVSRAKGRSWCHTGFYLGATADNIARLPELEKMPGCVGIKVFVGSSTGNLLLDDFEKIEEILKTTKRTIAFHSEDEERLKERKRLLDDHIGDASFHPIWRDEEVALISTRKLVLLANKNKRKIHILHITTAQEMEILAMNKDYVTVEVTPQHLTLAAPQCYKELGTLAQMNPPIRGEEHRAALWKALNTNVVDVLGSDHAPHTLEEKKKSFPESPSGMPGVQTMLPLMLHHMNEKRISLEKIVDLLSHRPAKLFALSQKGAIAIGKDADLSLVDLKAERRIENKLMATKVGWTPFDGLKVLGWPMAVVLAGEVAMRDNEVIGGPKGQLLEFDPV